MTLIKRIFFCTFGEHQYGDSYRVLTGKSDTAAYYEIHKDCKHCYHHDIQWEAFCFDGKRDLGPV